MNRYLILTFLLLSVFVLSGQNLTKKELRYKPANLEEAVQQLIKIIPDSTRQKILLMTENEFIRDSHFGLGMWIRNSWIYWGKRQLSKYFYSIGIYQADGMSGMILTSYYRQLHNQEWEVEDQVKADQLYYKLTQEHFQRLEKDTAYQREVKTLQDSLYREALNRKKLEWAKGSVISGYLKYQCGFLSLGETTKVKGVIVDWQDDSIVLKITQYFDEEKKQKLMKCNDIKDDILVIHNHKYFRLEE